MEPTTPAQRRLNAIHGHLITAGDSPSHLKPNLTAAEFLYGPGCHSFESQFVRFRFKPIARFHDCLLELRKSVLLARKLSRFFKESSEEEREHAEKFMKYQNIRGGRVILHPITSPPSEFAHAEKGDALYAMEIALSLEKLVNEKLLNLHSVAERGNDPQLADYVASEFLYEQVKAIKKIAGYVTQLRMAGKGHGVWHFDQRLLHDHE